MATKNQEAARSCKTETLEQVLTRIQCMHVPDYLLMVEHWDWLVVLQCLQDHHLFKINPKQPPLTEFVAWLEAHHVPYIEAHASVRTMSYANNSIAGARYPWDNVEWNRSVIRRWKKLYETLDSMLQDVTNVIE